MTSVVSCPWCLTRVIAKSDGNCPACGRNINDSNAPAEISPAAAMGQMDQWNDSDAPELSQEPTVLVAHYSGEVSSSGRLSPIALENFVVVLIHKIEKILDEVASSCCFEVVISCALLPDDKRIVQVETGPGDLARKWARRLKQAVNDTSAPPVEEGPVAFVIYNGSLTESGSVLEISPFSNLHHRIARVGPDRAFMEAAGLEEPSRPGIWQRILGFFGASSEAQPDDIEYSERSTYEGIKNEFEEEEQQFVGASIEQLQQFATESEPHAALHAALATRYSEDEKWAQAVASYTAAIECQPEFGLLYGRRGHVEEVAGDSRAALEDYGRGIVLAPTEPWLPAQRARVYASLEAWSAAEDDVTTAHELAPRDPIYLLMRAELRLDLEQPEAGLEDLTAALRLDPNSGHAHRLLGTVFQEPGSYDADLAIHHLTQAIELMPADVIVCLQRALAYASQNKLALAMEDCDRVIESKQELDSAYEVRGRLLLMQGDFEEACEACDRAIELGKNTAMVFLTRGTCRAALGDRELAMEDSDSALELEPDNPMVLHFRGNLDLEEGELDSAMEAFRRALQLAPSWSEPREQIALVHRINDNADAAVDEQSTLVDQEPKNPSHLVNRALAYAELGKYQEANDDFDRAVTLDPENDNIFYFRALFFIERQRFELALKDLDFVLSVADDNDDARLQRASALLNLYRPTEALQDFSKVIARHPDDPHAYLGRAYALELTGDQVAAESDYEHLAAISPDESEQITWRSLAARANYLQIQERLDEAMQVANELIAHAPEESLGYRIRAGVYWDMEQFVESQDDYSRCLEIEADSPEALSSRGQVQAEMCEWRLALDDLDLAIERSRKSGSDMVLAFALNGRALALAGLNLFDESTRDFEESVKLCASNPWVYFHRGMVMYSRGEHRDAKDLLEKALQLSVPPLSQRKRRRAEAVLERATRALESS